MLSSPKRAYRFAEGSHFRKIAGNPNFRFKFNESTLTFRNHHQFINSLYYQMIWVYTRRYSAQLGYTEI